ncbi:hypothetical protein BKA82DRAFT_1006192 [Pisolithus tinctorius]|uniref:Uncharacterized protein n=1 Tax=Pisolithus tinctorius Marx 270 TaxID=870435 RepID=A0A0C3N885_PISTI|nr:hypothetical protein BKA82DRAFT_1006192 [Pisolithus tinctorius]KIN97254.1 hypothetical protein M404DRAFT_1006192 [Pisolithus tinctorius Marx 270]
MQQLGLSHVALREAGKLIQYLTACGEASTISAAFRIIDRQPSYTFVSVVFGLHANVRSPRGSRPSHGPGLADDQEGTDDTFTYTGVHTKGERGV